MEVTTPKKVTSWPKAQAFTRKNATQQQQILHIRDLLVGVKQFSVDNPKRKVNAGYIYDLSSTVLDVVESLVGMPVLGDDLKEFIEQSKQATQENQ